MNHQDTQRAQGILTSYETRIANMVSAAANMAKEEISARATAGVFEPFNLYYRPGSEAADGELRLFPESATPAAPWTLATSEGLRCNVPYDSYFVWIKDRCGKLPVLSNS